VGEYFLDSIVSAVGLRTIDAFIPNSEGGDSGSVVRVTISEDEQEITTVELEDAPYGAAVSPNGTYILVTREESDSDCDDETAEGLATAIPASSFENSTSQVHIDVGCQPRGVAFESRGVYAYVANYGDDTVTKIATSTWTVTDTFDVGNEPWGVAATYDDEETSDKVYVSNHAGDSISVISSDGVEEIEDVGDGPLGLALTPDGQYLYVALFNADRVAIIDTQDLSVEKTVTVGDAPWGVAVGGSGGYVYVTNSGSDSVTVIDTDTQTAILTTSTGSSGDQPYGVAAPANGDYAYVVNHGGDSVTKVTPDGTEGYVDDVELDGAYGLGDFFGSIPPAAPSDLTAEAKSSSKIILEWTDNTTGETGFKVERRKDGEDDFSEVDLVDADITTYTNWGLQRDTTYDFRVRAYNEAADSAYSNEATATTENEKFSWCFIGSLLNCLSDFQ
jgi:YVTN family beta-propeller protein